MSGILQQDLSLSDDGLKDIDLYYSATITSGTPQFAAPQCRHRQWSEGGMATTKRQQFNRETWEDNIPRMAWVVSAEPVGCRDHQGAYRSVAGSLSHPFQLSFCLGCTDGHLTCTAIRLLGMQ
ncbi:UNVERIFIED_CONTAM: hypothetical protein K2H54_026601 [Gekko kuhli]